MAKCEKCEEQPPSFMASDGLCGPCRSKEQARPGLQRGAGSVDRYSRSPFAAQVSHGSNTHGTGRGTTAADARKDAKRDPSGKKGEAKAAHARSVWDGKEE